MGWQAEYGADGDTFAGRGEESSRYGSRRDPDAGSREYGEHSPAAAGGYSQGGSELAGSGTYAVETPARARGGSRPEKTPAKAPAGTEPSPANTQQRPADTKPRTTRGRARSVVRGGLRLQDKLDVICRQVADNQRLRSPRWPRCPRPPPTSAARYHAGEYCSTSKEAAYRKLGFTCIKRQGSRSTMQPSAQTALSR